MLKKHLLIDKVKLDDRQLGYSNDTWYDLRQQITSKHAIHFLNK